MSESPANNDLPSAGKFLNFQLGQERYSLPVTEVREIIRVCPITHVPRMPAHHLGVINLRGKIVPVMDLRRRLHLPPADNLERACIIVVHHQTEQNPDQLIGLQVDVVEEVAFIGQDAIEAAPDFCDVIDGKFIMAMAKSKESVITILSIEELLDNSSHLDAQTAPHAGDEALQI